MEEKRKTGCIGKMGQKKKKAAKPIDENYKILLKDINILLNKWDYTANS